MLAIRIGQALARCTRRRPTSPVSLAVGYRAGLLLARRPRTLEASLASGSTIVLSSQDPAHRHFFFHATWEPEVTAVVRDHVVPGAVVFDVGANAGYFGLLARDLGALVHAFEPTPPMLELLHASRRRAPERFEVFPVALSSESGRRPIHLGAEGNLATSSLDGTVPHLSGRSVEVEVTTIDAHVEATNVVPTLIKVDVERHERDVLRGARGVLTDHRPVLVVEMTDAEALDEVLAAGYRAWLITEAGLVPTGDLGPQGWANVLLVHPDGQRPG